MKQPKIHTIDITAREWFDRTYGNSYFSGFMTVNYSLPSEANFYLRFQYGYGSQYIDESKNILIKHGYIPKERELCALWRYCQENNIVLRTHLLENCKKAKVTQFE